MRPVGPHPRPALCEVPQVGVVVEEPAGHRVALDLRALALPHCTRSVGPTHTHAHTGHEACTGVRDGIGRFDAQVLRKRLKQPPRRDNELRRVTACIRNEAHPHNRQMRRTWNRPSGYHQMNPFESLPQLQAASQNHRSAARKAGPTHSGMQLTSGILLCLPLLLLLPPRLHHQLPVHPCTRPSTAPPPTRLPPLPLPHRPARPPHQVVRTQPGVGEVRGGGRGGQPVPRPVPVQGGEEGEEASG